MQRYLVSLFAINGSFRKGSVQEMWEDACVWEDDVYGFMLSPSLAFDKRGKRIVSQSIGRELLLLFGSWQPCLSPSFADLTNMLQQMSVLSARSQCMLSADDKDVVMVFRQLTTVWKSYL